MPERLAPSERLAPAPASRGRESERWLLNLIDAVDPALCGGKAAGLARLRRAGLPVPDGVCLTTELWRAAAQTTNLTALVGELAADANLDPRALRDRLAGIRRLVEGTSLPPELVEPIQRGARSLQTGWTGTLAVRSSAVLEDHADASHAGLHVSFAGQYTAESPRAVVPVGGAKSDVPRVRHCARVRGPGRCEVRHGSYVPL